MRQGNYSSSLMPDLIWWFVIGSIFFVAKSVLVLLYLFKVKLTMA